MVQPHGQIGGFEILLDFQDECGAFFLQTLGANNEVE